MNNKKVVFYCKICLLKITEQLKELIDLTKLSEEDGQDHLPQGNYLIAPDPNKTGGYYTNATG